jgi:hypothetical protein
MRRLASIGLIGLLVLAGCTSKKASVVASQVPSTSPSGSATAFQIQEQVVEAIRAAGSFHLVSVTKHGKQTATFVQDVGLTQGTQDITIGAERVSIRVIAGVAYVRANRLALLNFLGFPASIADRLHDRWVSFSSSDPGYSDISAAVTLDSAITEIAITGAVTKTPVTTMLGQSVFGLTGAANGGGTQTLYVRASGTPLLVQVRAVHKGDTQLATFSKWGERVLVAKPAGAVTFSSVAGSSGGTGA